jgi:hypothetical protein
MGKTVQLKGGNMRTMFGYATLIRNREKRWGLNPLIAGLSVWHCY